MKGFPIRRLYTPCITIIFALFGGAQAQADSFSDQITQTREIVFAEPAEANVITMNPTPNLVAGDISASIILVQAGIHNTKNARIGYRFTPGLDDQLVVDINDLPIGAILSGQDDAQHELTVVMPPDARGTFRTVDGDTYYVAPTAGDVNAIIQSDANQHVYADTYKLSLDAASYIP